jgi:hypothetical protein
MLDDRSEQKVTTLDKDLARNISANQRLLWPLAAILDNRSEQKVTTIDQNLVRNISAKYGSNPSSGS